jgi:hypothetical protein
MSLHEQLATLGWSQARLAHLVGCDGRTVRYWREAGQMPAMVAGWLDECIVHQRRYPDPSPPQRWAWAVDTVPGSLTAPAIAGLLARLGWSQQNLARLIGANRDLVRRWTSGERAMPSVVADWLRRTVAHRERHPLPLPPRPSDWKYRASRATWPA